MTHITFREQPNYELSIMNYELSIMNYELSIMRIMN